MMYSSRDLTDPASSTTRTTRHTSNCACNLPKTEHTRNVYSSTIATSKAATSTPDKLCTHTASSMNRQLLQRQALSALNARNSQVRNARKTEKSATQNLESLPKSQYIGSQTQPIPLHERPLLLRLQPHRLELFVKHGRRVMKHARHRLICAPRLFQPFARPP